MQLNAQLTDWLPTLATLLLFSLLIWLANWLMFRRYARPDGQFPRQLAMVLLSLTSLIALVISLPIGETTKGQILSLIGLLLSGLLAFSSTNIFTNLMAGLMMRFTRPFRTGDFIRLQGHAGRVTQRGLLDCEIQTETRDLVSLPNSLLITQPVTVVRSSGTLITLSLTLGYDLHHSRIETRLKQAASQAGLEDPFVYVTALGNFAVEYKVYGLLQDIKNLLTARSNLHKCVLDALHGDGIEILSPSVMAQRPQDPAQPVIAKAPRHHEDAREPNAEDLMFDKAEEAEQKEKHQHDLQAQLAELESLPAPADKAQKERLKQQIANIRAQLDRLKQDSTETVS